MSKDGTPGVRITITDEVGLGTSSIVADAAGRIADVSETRRILLTRKARGSSRPAGPVAVATGTAESARLREARRRIRELEAELAAAKRASELFEEGREGRVVRPKEIYPIVEALGAEGHGLKASCRLLGVSGSGFFHWRGRPLSARAVRRAWLADVVTEIWERSRRTYGWRRIQAELAEVHGHVANKKLLRAVMREHHISGLPRPKARRRDLTRAPTTADLVNREFSRDGSNLLWISHPPAAGASLWVTGWHLLQPVLSAPSPELISRRPSPHASSVPMSVRDIQRSRRPSS